MVCYLFILALSIDIELEILSNWITFTHICCLIMPNQYDLVRSPTLQLLGSGGMSSSSCFLLIFMNLFLKWNSLSLARDLLYVDVFIFKLILLCWFPFRIKFSKRADSNDLLCRVLCNTICCDKLFPHLNQYYKSFRFYYMHLKCCRSQLLCVRWSNHGRDITRRSKLKIIQN